MKYALNIKTPPFGEWAGMIVLSLLLTILISSSAFAQNADEYFHDGAKSFIGANLQDAINHVQEGLAQFPDDPKLNALLQKLEEEKEKQEQQQDQDQEQEQEQNQEQEEEEQQEQEQEQEQNQEQQESEGESEEEEPQDQEPESIDSQQISKEDAEKILQALAQKEKELLKEFKKKKTKGSAGHEKDW